MQITDCQQYVISTLMDENVEYRVKQKIVSELAPEQFYVSEYRMVYQAIDDLIRADKPVELPLIESEMGASALERTGGLAFLQNLKTFKQQLHLMGLSVQNIDHYVKIVDEAGKYWLISQAIEEEYKNFKDIDTLVSGSENAADAYTKLIERFSALRVGSVGGYTHISDAIEKNLITLGQIEKGELPLMNSNYPSLFNAGLFYRPSMGVIAGASSSGKSQLAFLSAFGTAINADPLKDAILIDSLETSDELLARRIICPMAAIDSEDFLRNTLTKEEKDRFIDVAKYIQKMNVPIFIEDNPSQTTSQTYTNMLAMSLHKDVIMSVHDFLELYSDRNNLSEELRISHITRNLRRAIYKVKACGVAISQLNSEHENKASKLGSLKNTRYSKSIYATIDWGGVIYNPIVLREKHEEIEVPTYLNPDRVSYILEKYKNGASGKIIEFEWISKFTRLLDPLWEPGFEFDMLRSHPIPVELPTPRINLDHSLLPQNGDGSILPIEEDLEVF